MATTPKSAALPIAVGVTHSGGRFLVARRKALAQAGGTWEFPGGKVRPGEPLKSALCREMEEEVGVRFRDAILLHVEEYAYPERTVLLHFFLCLDPEGPPGGREGQDIRWVTLSELKALEVPPANRRLLRLLEDQFGPE